MTIYTSEPGSKLGGRYRLEDRIAAGSGWAAWKAIDETLARAVTVFTFASGFPRIADVITAARAASRLTDPRLAQVFDVEDAQDRAYVVMEWAAGETLSDLLSHGPLEPARAAQLVAEAAAALSSAHSAGVAHMCLSPGSVRWSPTGEVKVVGLGIDAALSGVTSDDPVLADTQGLGRLLYTALTGYWPGPELPMLPQAPLADGEPLSPRQVLAGVPAPLSDLTCRAMSLRTRDASPPLRTPDELARDLLAAAPSVPFLPEPVPSSWRTEYPPEDDRWPTGSEPADGTWAGSASGQSWPDNDETDSSGRGHWPADQGSGAADSRDGHRSTDGVPGRRPPGRGAGHRGRDRAARGRAPLVIGAAIAAIALIAAAVVTLLPRSGTPQAVSRKPTGQATQQASKVTTLQPVGATGFDPLTPIAQDRGNSHSKFAQNAIDSSPATFWYSQWYKTAKFGGLKAGVGLMIDMGKPVRFTQVTVTFGHAAGSDVELLVGNSQARSKANLDSMPVVASATNATGSQTFTIHSKVTGRYLVIWFTKLPPKTGSHRQWFMAQVFNVTVNGYS